MPYRAAIVGDLELVEIDRGGPVPAFVGRIDDQRLIVRFDVAALAALAGSLTNDESVADALAVRSVAIKAAAQRLLREGFWTATEDGVEVLVTVLDI